MKLPPIITLLASTFTISSLSSAATIVSSVSDLSFTAISTASVDSNSGGTMVMTSAKNRDVYASLPNTYVMGLDDTMTVAFDIAFTGTDPIVSAATFDIRLGDGTNYYGVGISVRSDTTANGIGFSYSGANNGKVALEEVIADNTTYSFNFEIERSLLTETTMSFQASTIADAGASRTAGADLSEFNQILFRYTSAWDVSPAPTVTISNFSIDTTATPIPEPGQYAAMFGLAVMGLMYFRKKQ